MVVRALKDLGVTTAKVNERHDIVIAGNGRGNGKGNEKDIFKVSGSAYKLTRLRSLHHGTCLLNSPRLKSIGKYLRSPGEPYIKARGVESVRSPIRNVDVDTDEFLEGVVDEFRAMYEDEFGEYVEVTHVGEELKDMANIRKGMDELTVSKNKDTIIAPSRIHREIYSYSIVYSLDLRPNAPVHLLFLPN